MAASMFAKDPAARRAGGSPAAAGGRRQTGSTGRGMSAEQLARLGEVASRLPRYVKLARLILGLGPQAQVPGSGRARRFVLAGLAYLFAPLDPLPGFIPVLGQLDDLLVALFALRQALRSLPAPVQARVLRQAGLDGVTVEHDWRLVRDGTRDVLAATGRGAWHLGRRGTGALVRLGLRLGSLAGRGLGGLLRRAGTRLPAGQRPGRRRS